MSKRLGCLGSHIWNATCRLVECRLICNVAMIRIFRWCLGLGDGQASKLMIPHESSVEVEYFDEFGVDFLIEFH